MEYLGRCMCSNLPEAAVIQPAVVFRDILFREEECDIAVTDRKIAMIPPLQIDILNRRIANQSTGTHIMLTIP